MARSRWPSSCYFYRWRRFWGFVWSHAQATNFTEGVRLSVEALALTMFLQAINANAICDCDNVIGKVESCGQPYYKNGRRRNSYVSKSIRSLVVAAVSLVVLGQSQFSLSASAAEKKELQGTVTAVGSTALLPLVKQAAAEFMAKYPKVTINVSGGGSFTGLSQVAAGAADIGNSDVFATDDLKNKNLVDHQVAIAPFLIVTHPKVTVDSLTQEQLIGIFTGKITNWKEVGGPNQRIIIIGRASSSGSRATIKEIVLKGQEFAKNAIVQDSNGSVRSAIANTPGSIGYIDAAYLNDTVKAIAYNGIPYSPQNVISGKYPIYAFEHMYTKGQPEGATKAFLDYILSAEFQKKYVEKLGFIPVSDLKVTSK